MQFAVLTKVSRAELPYLKTFYKHYCSIGVSKFYIVCSEKGDLDLISALTRELNYFDVEIFIESLRNEGGRIGEYINHFKGRVDADYVLSIDIDELLHLNGHSLEEVVNRIPSDYYILPWRMVVNDTRRVLTPSRYARSRSYKYMVRPALVSRYYTHWAETTDSLSIRRFGRLYHYWGRSFEDILIKILYHSRISIKKRSGRIDLFECLERGELPLRFKVFAFLSLMRTWKLQWDIRTFEFDSDLENELLLDVINRSEIEEIYRKYSAMKMKIKSLGLPTSSHEKLGIYRLSDEIKKYDVRT